MSPAPITLPADVYDYLELSALAFGGIGGGRFALEGILGRKAIAAGTETPYCVLGHAAGAAEPGSDLDAINEHEVTRALWTAGIHAGVNDGAVRAINQRLGYGCIPEQRVPFDLWAAEVGVVRGDT